MVRRYTETFSRKYIISLKEIEVFECQECGFEFNAMHSCDDMIGGYECPSCEVDELKSELEGDSQ